MKIKEEITKSNGEYYATKPKKATPEALYVWRMLMFFISKNPKHQCIPYGADFELIKSYGVKEAQAKVKELDIILAKLIKEVPETKRYGMNAWRGVTI